METERQACNLLVLVPHRDIRRQMQKYSQALFSRGVCGAWSFPWVTPLAVLSNPLDSADMKRLAGAIRERTGECGGKIVCGPAARAAFPSAAGTEKIFAGKEPAVFGPALNLAAADSVFAGVRGLRRFGVLVVGAAVVYGDEEIPPADESSALPEISFRAAALANMLYRPLKQGGTNSGGAYSFVWETGELYWLPPVKKQKAGNDSGKFFARNGILNTP